MGRLRAAGKAFRPCGPGLRRTRNDLTSFALSGSSLSARDIHPILPLQPPSAMSRDRLQWSARYAIDGYTRAQRPCVLCDCLLRLNSIKLHGFDSGFVKCHRWTGAWRRRRRTCVSFSARAVVPDSGQTRQSRTTPSRGGQKYTSGRQTPSSGKELQYYCG